MADQPPELGTKLGELWEGPGLRRPHLYHHLGEQLRQLWHIESSEDSVFEMVVYQMEWLINQLVDPSWPPLRRQTELERLGRAVRVTYNFSISDIEALRGVVERRRWLYDQGGPSVSSTQKDMKKVLHRFVEILSDRATALPSRDELLAGVSKNRLASGDTIRVVHQSTYVSRHELETQFKALVDAGNRVIVLVGQVGMGKTWLARKVTKSASTRPVPWIRFRAGVPNMGDLQSVLTDHFLGMAMSGDPIVYIARLCCGDDAPPIVVLDNLDSADELIDILPVRHRSTIVATCRTKGVVKPEWMNFVEVDRLTSQEAVDAVLRNLPNTTLPDAKRLAESLHGYPVVIPRACALIRRAGISVEEFCKKLTMRRSGLAGNITTENRDTLMAVLNRIVGQLEAHDPEAYSLLLFSCYTHIYNKGAVAEAMLWEYFTRVLGRGGDRLQFETALGLLDDFGLVDVYLVTRYEHCDRNIFFHPFTVSMLYDLFPSRERDYLLVLRRLAEPYLNGQKDFVHSDPYEEFVAEFVPSRRRSTHLLPEGEFFAAVHVFTTLCNLLGRVLVTKEMPQVYSWLSAGTEWSLDDWRRLLADSIDYANNMLVAHPAIASSDDSTGLHAYSASLEAWRYDDGGSS